MILNMMFISCVVYLLVTNTIQAAIIVCVVFLLPVSIYNDYTRELNYKEQFLLRRK